MIRILALLPILTAVVFGGFFLWGLDPTRNPSEIPSVLIKQPAPSFDLPAIDGLGTPGFSRSDLVSNSAPVIVNVFASWCVPCRAEHAVLTRLVRENQVRLFGINYKDKPEDASRWLAELGNPYERIGSDLDGRAGIEWGLTGVPETFIVGGDGTVLYRYVGPIVGERAVSTFEAALAEAQGIQREGS